MHPEAVFQAKWPGVRTTKTPKRSEAALDSRTMGTGGAHPMQPICGRCNQTIAWQHPLVAKEYNWYSNRLAGRMRTPRHALHQDLFSRRHKRGGWDHFRTKPSGRWRGALPVRVGEPQGPGNASPGTIQAV